MRHRLLALGALFILAFSTPAGADVFARFFGLGSNFGQPCSAIDVNDHDDALVNCTPLNSSDQARPYVFPLAQGSRSDINGPADTTDCIAINNARQVACNTRSSGPFLWQNGSITLLGPAMQSVVGLNDLGEVVGRTNIPTGSGGTFSGLRRATGTIVTIPTSLFIFPVRGKILNNLSQVVVRPLTRPLFDTVGTWSPGAGYVPADRGWDFATSINDAGQMTSVLNGRAMLLTPGHGWQPLPVPPSFPSATASVNSVNSTGQMAGQISVGGRSRAVFWMTRAFPVELDLASVGPSVANDSSPSGWVVGSHGEPGNTVPVFWHVENQPLPLPQAAPDDAVFRWIPSDGSSTSGRMTITAAAAGPFSVAPRRVTSFDFTFAPGVSIQLLEGVDETRRTIMSFDGTGLDAGTIRFRRGPYAADALFELMPDALGADEASFDPLDEGHQQLIRRGRWVRENATPVVTPLPSGVLGVIDASNAFADDPFGVNSGIAYDSVRNVLYVARGANNRFIYTVAIDGSVVRRLDFQAAYLPNYIPSSLTYNAASDHLYVFATDSTVGVSTVVEMTTDGSQVIRAIPIPFANGTVRADGIWLPSSARLDHYSFDGTLLEQVSIAGSFQGRSPTALSTALATDPAGSFVLVDEGENRLVKVSRQGNTLAETTTRTFDVDHPGGARATATDATGQRMFLLMRSGAIVVLSPGFMNTQSVSDRLQLTSVSLANTPPGVLSVEVITITARFRNMTGSNICSLFFTIKELTVNGLSGLDQLEMVSIPSTGQQVQGFSEQVLGHAPVDLGAGADQQFTFRIDLASRQAFNFFVDAWGTPAAPGTSCR